MIVDDRAEQPHTSPLSMHEEQHASSPSSAPSLHIPHRVIFMAGAMCGIGMASTVGMITLLVLRFQ